MSRPLALDLFSGEFGMGLGMQRAGFDVVAVDNDPARLEVLPDDIECHEADALAFVRQHGHRFAVIHGSPTCTGYSRGTAAIPDRLDRYDRLIAATRAELIATGKPYTIENVADARRELIDPVMLCGRMFGLTATDDDGTLLHLDRHRLFESNMRLTVPPHAKHDKSLQVAGAYGGARRDKHEARHVRKGGYVPPNLDVLRALLGAPDWMTEKGVFLSIPPVYAEYLYRQIAVQIAGR